MHPKSVETQGRQTEEPGRNQEMRKRIIMDVEETDPEIAMGALGRRIALIGR